MTDLTAPVARGRRSATDLRAALLTAAEQEFERGGYVGATTAAIARRAATTEAQLFRYFPSKSDLFRAAIVGPLNAHLRDFMVRLADGIVEPSSTPRQAQHYIAELQQFITEHGRMFLSLVTTDAYPSGVEGVAGVDALQEYFSQGAATMRSRTGGAAKLAPELMVRVSFATVLACTIFREWMFPASLTDEAEIRGAVARFVTDGLYGVSASDGLL